MRPLISKSGGEGKGESEKGEIATIPPYKGPQKCTQFAKNRTSSSIYFQSRPTSPSPRMPFRTISIDKRSPPPPSHPFPDRRRTKKMPPAGAWLSFVSFSCVKTRKGERDRRKTFPIFIFPTIQRSQSPSRSPFPASHRRPFSSNIPAPDRPGYPF